MRISLQEIAQITTAATLIVLTLSSSVSAQTSEVDAMYEANSTRPLGGLFAKGFTRTFTLLGGWNFAAADLPGEITSIGQLDSVDVGSTATNLTLPLEELSLIFLPENEESRDTGFAISAAMGRRHSHRLRSEIEFAVRENEFNRSLPGFIATDLEADVNVYSLMKNVIFEMPNQTRFTPYAGAGIGISWLDIDAETTVFDSTTTTSELSENDTALTYQAIGGVSTRVNQAMDFVVEYRFLGTGDIEVDTLGSAPYQVNNLFLGLKLEY